MKALQIPVTLYLYRSPEGENVAFTSASMGEYGYTPLDTKTIMQEFIIPDHGEIIGRQINALNAEKSRVTAEYQLKQSIIDDKIQRLLCIEHDEFPADEHDFLL